jgi:serine phosphatase RsbU (regulator of sigma subunit)
MADAPPEGKVPPKGPPSQPKMKAATPPASPPSKPQIKAAQPAAKPAAAPAPSQAKPTTGPVSQAKIKAASPPPGPASQPRMKAAPSIPTAEIVDTPSRPRMHERPAPRGDASQTKVRHRADAAPPKGMGLQLKIMLAMGLTSLLGAAGIAVAVYSRTTAAFEEEINSRGDRLVDILAAVPVDYWMSAIHGSERTADFVELVKFTDPVEDFAQKPEYARLKELLVEKPPAALSPSEIEGLLTAIAKDASWKSKLEANADAKARFTRLLRPLPFSGLSKEGDLVDVGVVDPAKNAGIMPSGRVSLNLPPPRGSERITTVDVPVNGVPTRMFILNPDPGAPVPLRYFVTLSLRKIEIAKKSLLQMILIPALIAVGASLAIAAILSHHITKPVRLLMSDIAQVSAGNFQHQTTASSSDEIGQLAASFNRMTGALRTAQEQELTTRALEHELGIASEIQTNLVPKTMLKVPGYDVGAYYRPSKEVGGDYYDFIEIDENRSGLIVADVSGKGVPGSLVMAMARAFIRMEAERNRNPSTADTLARSNRMLARDMRKGMFVTAIYGILDRTNHQVRVSSAGHNPMLLWRARTEEIVLVNPKGIALGLDKGPVFDRSISEEIIQLEPGDRVVFYTDGAVEAMNAKREEFGDRPFQDLVKKLAKVDSNQFLNLLVKAIDEHQGSAPQHDDMTIVTFRRT